YAAFTYYFNYATVKLPRNNKTGKETYGVGVSSNITRAGFRAMFSAVNRLEEQE
ncbi:MAG: alpha-isopropylmalate synthase regulatory domain-containing protein, partial [Sellimonas sp.]|uniref:alpha-isopropylmalate synthase regulatory domain-containing protein n=1 Tax=Sellimonas sp. TaxID=2021466 RepID=UPI0039A1E636